jgi:hypothetical protein
MALNSSGPISLGGTTAGQSIEKELGNPGTYTISLNDTAVRSLAGVPSGAIAMPTNFWGKSTTLAWTYRVNFVNMWTNLVNSPFVSQLIYANSAYVGAAYEAAGCAVRSTDGVTWTKYVLPWANYTVGQGIAWNGSIYCIVGSGGNCATSSNGTTWTNQTGLSSVSTSLGAAIVWSGSKFCCLGTGGTCATSTDGVTWTNQPGFATAYGASAGNINQAKIIYANSLFWAAVYNSTSGSATILKSSDGVTWTIGVNNASASGGVANIAYYPENGVVYALLQNGFLLYYNGTSGGLNLSLYSALGSGKTYKDMIWDGGRMIVGANGGIVATSYDVNTWINQSTALQATTFGTNNVLTIASNGTQTVVGGVYGATSP